MLGDRVFYLTDNAHLIALDRLTGALLWDVDTPEGAPGQFGGTAAPLVVGDLVVTGVSGGDNGIRGFVAAYKAATGELAWKFMTIPKPGDTGPDRRHVEGFGAGAGRRRDLDDRQRRSGRERRVLACRQSASRYRRR